eukprot:TRINITY_DN5344_c0_g2_i1.p1 TRINITY_DN5344_c0_g2~~TRINITY_DN5344_c0_g2_i1.p1  ORF type:complete len:5220 (+),score=634.47 TRINITY_DN5344_c0_g2_i1:1608-17267(+)
MRVAGHRLRDCKSMCSRQTDCEGFAFDLRNSHCYLRSTGDGGTSCHVETDPLWSCYSKSQAKKNTSIEDQTESAQSSCCPASSFACAGCMNYDSTRDRCKSCEPGYSLQKDGSCSICSDLSDWMDPNGLACRDYELSGQCEGGSVSIAWAGRLDQLTSRGVSPMAACCACGGGSRIMPKFAYEVSNAPLVMRHALPRIFPAPRTASEYTAKGCNLHEVGLALDSSTGEVTGVFSGEEASVITCSIEAYDDRHFLRGAAQLVLDFRDLTYPSSVLLAVEGSHWMPRYAGTPHSFEVLCTPVLSWLKIDPINGELYIEGGNKILSPRQAGCTVTAKQRQCVLSADSENALPNNVTESSLRESATSLAMNATLDETTLNSTLSDKSFGVPSTVKTFATLSFLQLSETDDANCTDEAVKAEVMVLVPNTPVQLYLTHQDNRRELSDMRLMVGEQVPRYEIVTSLDAAHAWPMDPVGPITIHCGAGSKFDKFTSTLLYQGHEVFSLTPAGKVIGTPSSRLLSTCLDDTLRCSLSLPCVAFAEIPNTGRTVSARFIVDVVDSTAWVPARKASSWNTTEIIAGVADFVGCRHHCQELAFCAAFSFKDDQCWAVLKVGESGTTPLDEDEPRSSLPGSESEGKHHFAKARQLACAEGKYLHPDSKTCISKKGCEADRYLIAQDGRCTSTPFELKSGQCKTRGHCIEAPGVSEAKMPGAACVIQARVPFRLDAAYSFHISSASRLTKDETNITLQSVEIAPGTIRWAREDGDSSASFMSILSRSRNRADSWRLCPIQRCACPHGTPQKHGCERDGILNCSACEAGYSLRDGQCSINICTACSNGVAARGTDCDSDGGAVCSRCDDGYHLPGELPGFCEENRCTCKNGVPRTGRNCTNHNAEDCEICNAEFHSVPETGMFASWRCEKNSCFCLNGYGSDHCTRNGTNSCGHCYPGYHAERDENTSVLTCVENRCECMDGKGSSGRLCDANGSSSCSGCDIGFHLTKHSPPRCSRNSCSCANGTAATGSACHTHGLNLCVDPCDVGFVLLRETCVETNCTCPNGFPALGMACSTNDSVMCESCKEGFHIEEDKCQSNTCQCENGVAATASACLSPWATLCETCNPGFTLFGNVFSSLCLKNTCTCANGRAAENENCTTDGIELCTNCSDSAFELVNGICERKACQCRNGKPQLGSDCIKHNSEHCASCDFGFVLNGRLCEACPTVLIVTGAESFLPFEMGEFVQDPKVPLSALHAFLPVYKNSMGSMLSFQAELGSWILASEHRGSQAYAYSKVGCPQHLTNWSVRKLVQEKGDAPSFAWASQNLIVKSAWICHKEGTNHSSCNHSRTEHGWKYRGPGSLVQCGEHCPCCKRQVCPADYESIPHELVDVGDLKIEKQSVSFEECEISCRERSCTSFSFNEAQRTCKTYTSGMSNLGPFDGRTVGSAWASCVKTIPSKATTSEATCSENVYLGRKSTTGCAVAALEASADKSFMCSSGSFITSDSAQCFCSGDQCNDDPKIRVAWKAHSLHHQALCAGHRCGYGWIPKPRKSKITCFGSDGCTHRECCIKTCEGFRCGAEERNKPDMPKIQCLSTTCDKSECCEPACAEPHTTGYDLSLTHGILLMSKFNMTGARCDKGYMGDAQIGPCTVGRGAYVLSGCEAVCVTPSTEGYFFGFASGSLLMTDFQPAGVTCATGYGGGNVTYRKCPVAGTPYGVSGCRAFGCTTGSGPMCKECKKQGQRAADNHCQSCNPGHDLVGTSCQAPTTTTTTTTAPMEPAFLAMYAIGSVWFPFDNMAEVNYKTLLTKEVVLPFESVVIFTGHGHGMVTSTASCVDASIFIDGRNPHPYEEDSSLQYGGNFVHNTHWTPQVTHGATLLPAGKHTFELKVKGRPGSARHYYRAPVLTVESFSVVQMRAWFAISHIWTPFENKRTTTYTVLLTRQITLTSESVVILTGHGHGRVTSSSTCLDAVISVNGQNPNPHEENADFQYGGGFTHSEDWSPHVMHAATTLAAGTHTIELKVRSRGGHGASFYRAPVLTIESFPVSESRAWYAVASSWALFDSLPVSAWHTLVTADITLTSESVVTITGHGHGCTRSAMVVAIFVDDVMPNNQGSSGHYGAAWVYEPHWISVMTRTATTLAAGRHTIHLKATKYGEAYFHAPVLTVTAARAQTLEDCTWTAFMGYHLNGAGQNLYKCRAATNVEDAKAFCASEPTCIGFDWRQSQAGQNLAQCWYHGGGGQLGGDGVWEGGGQSGSYTLNNRPCKMATWACHSSSEIGAGRGISDKGLLQPWTDCSNFGFATMADCQSRCASVPACYAANFDATQSRCGKSGYCYIVDVGGRTTPSTWLGRVCVKPQASVAIAKTEHRLRKAQSITWTPYNGKFWQGDALFGSDPSITATRYQASLADCQKRCADDVLCIGITRYTSNGAGGNCWGWRTGAPIVAAGHHISWTLTLASTTKPVIVCGRHRFCLGWEGENVYCYGSSGGCKWGQNDCQQDADCAKYGSSSPKYTDADAPGCPANGWREDAPCEAAWVCHDNAEIGAGRGIGDDGSLQAWTDCSNFGFASMFACQSRCQSVSECYAANYDAAQSRCGKSGYCYIVDRAGSTSPSRWSGKVCVKPDTCSAISLRRVNSIVGNNVASQNAGGIPFGSSSLAGYCGNSAGGEGSSFGGSGIHCWDNINDGMIGNSHSWIPATWNGNAVVGVRFLSLKIISGIRVSRDGHGTYSDRTSGSYEVSYSVSDSATYNTADSQWCSAGTFTRPSGGYLYFEFSQSVAARAIRIKVSNQGSCIDELVVYEASQAHSSFASFVVAHRGSNECPAESLPIRTASECANAADKLGKSYADAGAWPDSPHGCLTSEWDGRGVYFNSHPHGGRYANQAPICKRAKTEALSTLAEYNFNDRGDTSLNEGRRYRYTLANGYGCTLFGWTHTRNYAMGFLRNRPGRAYAVVSGLAPGEHYLWKVYQYAKSFAGTNQLLVNGLASLTASSQSTSATGQGRAVADINGKITFTFIRQSHHVHLSGLAVAYAQQTNSTGGLAITGSYAAAIGANSATQATTTSHLVATSMTSSCTSQPDCVDCSSSNVCTLCKPGRYLMSDGSCRATCPRGYFAFESDYGGETCGPCAHGCLECSGNNLCMVCNSSTYLVNGMCVAACPPSFFEAQAASGRSCQDCSADCYKCSNRTACSMCKNWKNLHAGNCTEDCPDGYYAAKVGWKGRECQQCSAHCRACTSSTRCSQCKNGKYLFNGSCQDHCPQVGYYPRAGGDMGHQSCQECTANCNRCSGNNTCIECKQDQYLLNGSCVEACPSQTHTPGGVSDIGRVCNKKQCAAHCLACTAIGSRCTGCTDDKYLLHGTCLDACPAPYLQIGEGITGRTCKGSCANFACGAALADKTGKRNITCATHECALTDCCDHVDMVYVKTTDTSMFARCMDLYLPDADYISGQYCPRDVRDLGLPVFSKPAPIVSLSMFLQPYRQEREWKKTCDSARTKWVLRRWSPHDVMLPPKDEHGKTIVELHGEILMCIEKDILMTSFEYDSRVRFHRPTRDVDFPTQSHLTISATVDNCKSPVKERAEAISQLKLDDDFEGDAAVLQAFRFDDPTSVDIEDDFSLGPCECPPEQFGDAFPIDTSHFAQRVPPGSGNSFVPAPDILFSGSVSCPYANLRKIMVSIGEEDCRLAAREAKTRFYWVGVVNTVEVCRLYEACDAVQLEHSSNGQLYGWVGDLACAIANPGQCMLMEKRREILTGWRSEAINSDANQPCLFQETIFACEKVRLEMVSDIQQCAMCLFKNNTNKMSISSRRPLPDAFPSSSQLLVSCHKDYWRGMERAGTSLVPHVRLSCVDGRWIHEGATPLALFTCEAGVRVTATSKDSLLQKQRSQKESEWWLGKHLNQIQTWDARCLISENAMLHLLEDCRQNDETFKWALRPLYNAEGKVQLSFGDTGQCVTLQGKMEACNPNLEQQRIPAVELLPLVNRWTGHKMEGVGSVLVQDWNTKKGVMAALAHKRVGQRGQFLRSMSMRRLTEADFLLDWQSVRRPQLECIEMYTSWNEVSEVSKNELYHLEAHVIRCPPTYAIQQIMLNRHGQKYRYDYACCALVGLGVCEAEYLGWTEYNITDPLSALAKQVEDLRCPQHSVIHGYLVESKDPGNSKREIRHAIECCEIQEFPPVIIKTDVVFHNNFSEFDGVYFPTGRTEGRVDMTANYMYQQNVPSGVWMLRFNMKTGKWCMQKESLDKLCEASDAIHPLQLGAADGFEVTSLKMKSVASRALKKLTEVKPVKFKRPPKLKRIGLKKQKLGVQALKARTLDDALDMQNLDASLEVQQLESTLQERTFEAFQPTRELADFDMSTVAPWLPEAPAYKAYCALKEPEAWQSYEDMLSDARDEWGLTKRHDLQELGEHRDLLSSASGDSHPCKHYFQDDSGLEREPLPAKSHGAMIEGELDIGISGIPSYDIPEIDGNFANGLTIESLDAAGKREMQRQHDRIVSEVQSHAMSFGAQVEEALTKLPCTAIPKPVTSPLGFGITINPDNICSFLVETLMDEVKRRAGFQGFKAEVEEEEAAIADAPIYEKGPYYKIYCDLHCIEDAVYKGNMAVLSSLHGQTQRIESRVQQMMRHYFGEVFEKLKETQQQINHNHKQQDKIAKGYAGDIIASNQQQINIISGYVQRLLDSNKRQTEIAGEYTQRVLKSNKDQIDIITDYAKQIIKQGVEQNDVLTNYVEQIMQQNTAYTEHLNKAIGENVVDALTKIQNDVATVSKNQIAADENAQKQMQWLKDDFSKTLKGNSLLQHPSLHSALQQTSIMAAQLMDSLRDKERLGLKDDVAIPLIKRARRLVEEKAALAMHHVSDDNMTQAMTHVEHLNHELQRAVARFAHVGVGGAWQTQKQAFAQRSTQELKQHGKQLKDDKLHHARAHVTLTVMRQGREAILGSIATIEGLSEQAEYFAASSMLVNFDSELITYQRSLADFLPVSQKSLAARQRALAVLLDQVQSPSCASSRAISHIGKHLALVDRVEERRGAELRRVWSQAASSITRLVNILVDGGLMLHLIHISAASLPSQPQTWTQMAEAFQHASRPLQDALRQHARVIIVQVSQAFNTAQHLADTWGGMKQLTPRAELVELQQAWAKVRLAAKELRAGLEPGGRLWQKLMQKVTGSAFPVPALCEVSAAADKKSSSLWDKADGFASLLSSDGSWWKCDLQSGQVQSMELPPVTLTQSAGRHSLGLGEFLEPLL